MPRAYIAQLIEDGGSLKCSRCDSHLNILSNGYCKDCMAEYSRENSGVINPRIDNKDGTRKCSSCKNDKLLEDFVKDKKCSGGRGRKCKVCVYKGRSTPENKQKQKELSHNHYIRNKENYLERQAKRYQDNSEELKAYARQHAKDNPEIYRAAFHRRRQRVIENGTNDLTAEQIKYLLNNNNCFYCDSDKRLTIDHLKPISKGGQNTISNVVVACFECNNKKRTKTVEEFISSKVY